MLKTFCISHVKDVDGLGAAALSVAATGGQFILSDYDRLLADLDRVPRDAERVVITDLGTDTTTSDRFAAKLGELAGRAQVTYIDHHFASDAVIRKIKRKGVRFVHDTTECASMLAYLTFRKKLPDGAGLVALCGAVTDYMDDSPAASALMERSDRQFVLLEATMLAYALAKKGDEAGFPEMIVKELAAMKLPHEIPGVPELSVDELNVVAALGKEVKRRGRKDGRLAYMVTKQHSTGGISKLLIGAFDVPVGVALREKEEGWYEVSLRSTSECRTHLGKAISAIASSLGGNGGGHANAAGARIPKARAEDMLSLLGRKV